MGGTMATNPANLQPSMNVMGGAGIGLNWVARVSTNA